MKLTVKLDFGCGREIKVGTFSEIGRDTAFEFAGEFLSSGLDPAPFRLRAGGGLKIYDRSGNMETFGLFDDSLSVSGEGANPGVDDLRRLAKDVGLDRDESEPILDCVIESCRALKGRKGT